MAAVETEIGWGGAGRGVAGWQGGGVQEDELTAGARRMFLAVRPPAEVVAALDAALPRPHEPGVRWAAVDTWHLTIRFFPRVAAADVMAAVERCLPLPPATVTLGPVVDRLSLAVVVPVTGLDPLAAAVRAACAGLDDEAPERPFRGHLTLGRVRTRRHRCSLDGHPAAGTFPATTLELVDSALGPHGQDHRHTVVCTWPVPPAA